MLSRNSFRFLVIVALAILVIPLAITTPGAYADGDDNQFTPPEKTELKYPNLGSMLNQMVARVEEGESSAQDAAGDAPVNQGASVAVTIYLSGNVDDVVGFLEDNGGDPRNVGEDYIEAYVPVRLLGRVSEQPGVIRVRAIVPPQDQYGDILSQGAAAHLAPAWNQAGYSGQGVKVGVIDGNFGFRGFDDLIGTELPTPVGVRCYPEVGQPSDNLADCAHPDSGSVHGTAVAEAVMDVAPEVSLYVASPLSRADTNDTVDWMVSQGVSVIVRSESSRFDGPGDGTSPDSLSPLKTVDRAVDGGIIWVNSAGNAAQRTWFGDYSDADDDGRIEFSGSDETIALDFEESDVGERHWFSLRWDDSWDGATRDFDLYLVNVDTGVKVASSEDPQTGGAGQDPIEYLYYDVPDVGDYEIIVYHFSGSVPDWIQLHSRKEVLDEHATGHHSITNPAESANPGMLAVGASHYYDTNSIASYSSRGPTPDDRLKPEIVGVACGQAASYPQRITDGFPCWFSGTSQAAPHVAGLAALVKQRFPEYTPGQVADYLKDNAEERGVAGPDNTWGHGFAQLPTPDAVAPPPLREVVFAEPNWYSVQLQTHLARYMVEKGYGYTTRAVPGSTLDLLQGLRDGDNQVLMEVWLPNQREIWDAAVAAGEILDLGTSLDHDWQSAFVIPAYLQEQHPTLDNVEDLRQQRYKDLFATAETGGKARLVSCVVGWECENVNRQQIEGYGLVDHVHIVNPPSGAALNSSLYDAYELGEPWLGYQWGTSDPVLLLDLVRLEEPEYSNECWFTTKACAYEDSTILIGAHSSLPNWAPELAHFLREWDFSVDVHLKSVARWQADNPDASIEDAARYWLSNNVSTWSEWVTEEAAAGILATLPDPTDQCGQTLTGDGSVSGEWAEGCDSQVSERGHARYYSFTLAQESAVTITLESSDADTYLYLREGEAARSGGFLHESDDYPELNDTDKSQIEQTLLAGTYTIEATTFDAGETGSFTLTLSGLGASTTPPQSCSVGQTLAPGDGCNHQDFSIEINSSGTAIMRFTGTSIDFADLSLTRSGNSWNIESLP